MKAKSILTLIEQTEPGVFDDLKRFFSKKLKEVGCQIDMFHSYPMATATTHSEDLYLYTSDGRYDICYRYLLRLKSALKGTNLSFEIQESPHLYIRFKTVPKTLDKIFKPRDILFEIQALSVTGASAKDYKIDIVIFFNQNCVRILKAIEDSVKIQMELLKMDEPKTVDIFKNEIKTVINLIVKAIRLTTVI